MSSSCFKLLIFTLWIIDFVTASANDSLIKCCKSNQVYELSARECLVANYTQNVQIFGDLTNFGAPNCDNASVTVEYDSEKFGIRLTDGELHLPAYGSLENTLELQTAAFCVDDVASTDAQSHWMVKACRPQSVCDHIPCVRKCCGDGEKMTVIEGATSCVDHSKGIQPTFHHITEQTLEEQKSEVFGVMHYLSCPKFKMQPEEYDEDIHHFDVITGHLYKPEEKEWVKHSDYCIDVFTDDDGDTEKLATFVCFEKDGDENAIWWKPAMFLTSAVCLGLTLLIFFVLPSSLNIQKKAVIRYVACLFVAFLFLSVTWLFSIAGTLCKIISYVIYLGFLTAFAWLSVMCFDMWVSSRLTASTSAGSQKKFTFFCMYAWGVPATLFIVVYLMDTLGLVHENVLPNLGISSCWFQNHTAVLIYFLAPAGLMISANCILCFLTIWNYKRISRQASYSLHSSSSTGKSGGSENFEIFTYCKIVFVMGVPWLFEILATLFPKPKQIWVVTDTINSLQGLFIFIIFVLNRKVLSDLRSKFGRCRRGAQPVPTDAGISMSDLELRTNA